jgi:transcriptional regulator with XRE-family HTH domain
METNKRLQSWLETNHMKQNDLARDLNVSEALVSRVMSGERPATGTFRWRFAEQFGYDTAQTVFGEEDQTVAESLPEVAA